MHIIIESSSHFYQNNLIGSNLGYNEDPRFGSLGHPDTVKSSRAQWNQDALFPRVSQVKYLAGIRC